MLGPSTWSIESLVAEKTVRVTLESRNKMGGGVGNSREKDHSAGSKKTRDREGCFRQE